MALAGAAVLALVAVAACGPTTPPVPPTRSAPVPCALFPADSVWNTPVDRLPVDPRSATYLARIGLDAPVYADFGAGTYQGAPIGIPYNVVPRDAAKQGVTFDYADESDRGPYPIPATPAIEGRPGATSGDRHVLMVEAGTCRLYELYAARKGADGRWRAGSGAIWDLGSNALRPARLDLGRRRRPADPPRARPLRRGRRRRDPARARVSPRRRRRTRSCGRRGTRQATPTPRSRRWGCGCG